MPMNVATIQNTNGQAITLANKHKDKRDPKNWKGFKFAVPFEYSMHNFLLRYYVAEARPEPRHRHADPRGAAARDGGQPARRQHRRLPGPRPVQPARGVRGMGFIHILTKEIWDGHPCCAFGTSTEPSSSRTPTPLPRCTARCSPRGHGARGQEPRADRQGDRARAVPEPARDGAAQVLTGKFADGLGNVKNVPDRADFDPMPWQSMAVWMLTQMKRWGYVKGDVNYKQIAEKVFLLTDAKKHMKAAGQKVPDGAYKKFKVMGKEFDPAKPDAYVKSFAISKAADGCARNEGLKAGAAVAADPGLLLGIWHLATLRPRAVGRTRAG
jgi:nitrate/nitrite transport system substrate-binding protein